jgi:hypothetical protein
MGSDWTEDAIVAYHNLVAAAHALEEVHTAQLEMIRRRLIGDGRLGRNVAYVLTTVVGMVEADRRVDAEVER